MLYAIQAGHPGGSLSVCEILATLYHSEMKVDPANPNWEDRDRLVLSKGHGSPMLYIILSDLGFFPKEERYQLRKAGGMLQGHPSTQTPGIDFASGPLGLGLPAACGIAAGATYQNKAFTTYVILGDGELQEGAVWEGLLFAGKYKLDNLIIIVDHNKVQLDGTVEEIMPLGNLTEKFNAFGLHTQQVDGHNPEEISAAIQNAKQEKSRASVIIAHTIKGKGINFMEGQASWHGAVMNEKEYKKATEELGGEVL